jgi:hypothetical protein
MKKFVFLLSLLVVGCDQNIQEDRSFRDTIPGLEGCRKFENVNPMSSSIVIVRCPNSTTTSKINVGKTHGSIIVVDGIEYEKVGE